MPAQHGSEGNVPPVGRMTDGDHNTVANIRDSGHADRQTEELFRLQLASLHHCPKRGAQNLDESDRAAGFLRQRLTALLQRSSAQISQQYSECFCANLDSRKTSIIGLETKVLWGPASTGFS